MATKRRKKASPARQAPARPVRFTGALLLQRRRRRGLAAGPDRVDVLLKSLGLGSALPLARPSAALAVGAAPSEQERWLVVEPLAARAAGARGAVDEDALLRRVEELLVAGDDDLEFVEPELEYTLDFPTPPPSAALAGVDLWHHRHTEVEAAWRKVGGAARAGQGVVVAHLDTGLVDQHEMVRALLHQERVLVDKAWDFVDKKAGAADPMKEPSLLHYRNPGHGTGTVGVLAARPEPGQAQRYSGTAPGVTVLPVRAGSCVVQIRTRQLGNALFYAAQQGASVITLSMGGLPSQYWAAAVNEAYQRGTLLVAAAGNHFAMVGGALRTPTGVVYPARFERALAVSGVTGAEERYRLERGMSGNDGPEVGLCAPTPEIWWADAKSAAGYQKNGGTSSATPQVAGAAAMWLAHHQSALESLPLSPWARVENVRRALLRSAQKVGLQHGAPPYLPVSGEQGRTRNDWFGDGRLDCAAALDIAPVSESALVQRPPADARGAVLKLLGLDALWRKLGDVLS